jgi:hypothetical protein
MLTLPKNHSSIIHLSMTIKMMNDNACYSYVACMDSDAAPDLVSKPSGNDWSDSVPKDGGKTPFLAFQYQLGVMDVYSPALFPSPCHSWLLPKY